MVGGTDSATDSATARPPASSAALGLRAAVLAAVVIVLDQLTKWWAVETLFGRSFDDPALFTAPYRAIEVTGFFNWVLVGNTGVSFGLFSGAGTWVFVVIALIIAAFMLGWLLRSGRRWLIWPVGLIVGGAIGNVIDRLRFGAVVDFIQLHAAGFYWPAFNIADSAISIAMVIVIAEALFGPRQATGARGK